MAMSIYCGSPRFGGLHDTSTGGGRLEQLSSSPGVRTWGVHSACFFVSRLPLSRDATEWKHPAKRGQAVKVVVGGVFLPTEYATHEGA